ncbi:MAG: PTS transporter subunit EIIC [Lactimicrobium sp.]|jgi:PTS system cellobiose-specific IIC component|uniref:PTS sugar transporter subunit IIC n=1 Tax=Lactimicrobium sp. TaxID=2563780 RepID=UPI002F34F955
MNEKLMNGLLNIAGKMQSNKVLSAIKDAFIDNMPIVIVGAFCTLFQWVVFHHDPAGSTTVYLSIANIPGLSWLEYLTPIATTANYGCMNFMAVNVCVLTAMHYAENLGRHGDKTVPVLAISSLVTLMNTSITAQSTAADVVTASNGALQLAKGASESTEISLSAGAGVLQSFTDANALFVGLLVGILVTLLYVKLVNSGKVTIKLPDSVPPNVSASFAVLFPVAICILVVSVVGFIFNTVIGTNIFDLMAAIMEPLKAIMTGLPGYLLVTFLALLLWFFGIHGDNVMSAVTAAFFTQASAENLAIYNQTGIPYKVASVAATSGYSIISNAFNSSFYAVTGSGLTGGLVIAIMLFSKRDDYKAIAKLAIPCAIFDINEPVIFGIPLVMNPLFAIPFFMAPIASIVIGYVLTKIGFCPIMVVDAPWTTPPVLLGFLSSGGKLTGALTQLICLAASVVIYSPFVIAANKQPAQAAA